MKRILFLIHDLGPRGAEKVLVNLVNGMDRTRFDISVKTLFNWGPNRQFLKPDVHYSSWMPMDIRGNSHWMKLWTPAQLWKMIVPEKYDIAVSFLEGPCARVAGGCPQDGTKVIDWIHSTKLTEKSFLEGFRDRSEAEQCYGRAEMIAAVSKDVQAAFLQRCPLREQQQSCVLYNVFESDQIRMMSRNTPNDPPIDESKMNWCGVGRLVPEKRWDAMLKIQKRLLDSGYPARLYLLGDGPLRKELTQLAGQLGIRETVYFTGYQTNPYQYLSKCMLFVCSSAGEGFSSAVVESLLVGTPVCTVDVGGMREILGGHNEYGVITEKDDESLWQAVRRFFEDAEHRLYYSRKANERALFFEKKQAVSNIENMLLSV